MKGDHLMGMMDKVKGLLGGHKDQVSDGIDKAAAAVKEKTPDQVDGQVDTVAEKAKDATQDL
jgi:hypothetical protein